MLANNTILQDRYRIIEQIGRGGMGAVYKAVDSRLRSTVALKQTLVEGEPLRKAFEREAQMLASLHHPTLPRVSDHFIDERGQFLVMEYIPSDDFGALLQKRQRPFELDDVLRWSNQLLDALDYLHSRTPPIVHRDIKPQNLKLTDRNDIILLDFGLAKGSSVQTRVTSTGSIFGYTPHYAPVEQIHGTGTDRRSDLYALAATMYHLLTNTTPVDAVTRATAKVNDEPDPLVPIRDLNPAVPLPIAAVIEQAMAQKASQRPDSAAAMRVALQAAAEGKLPQPLVVPDTYPAPSDPTVPHIAGPHRVKPAEPVTATTQPPPPAGTARRRGVWLAVAVPLALILAVAGVFAARAFGAAAPAATAQALVAAVPTSPATFTPPPTALPTAQPTTDIMEAAQATFTGQTATAQAIDNLVVTAGVRTATALAAAAQTSLALTPTATPTAAPTTAPSAEPTAVPTSKPEPTRNPTVTPKPAQPPATPKPAQPTAVPAPTTPPTAVPATPVPATPVPAANGAVLAIGSGALFQASADIATIPADQGKGGSCIAGKVLAADGSTFSGFGVLIDNRGNTQNPAVNAASGSYRLCGLGAGEWGIAIYAAGGVDIPAGEQSRHQVRVRASGIPGEIFYINFRATADFKPLAPTATPVSSPYDGKWAGTVTGKTEGGTKSFSGSFRMEVRNGAVYSISTDGASCIFDHYPNFPKGQPIGGNSFGLGGQVFNPQDSSTADIAINIDGTFGSAGNASGNINASRGGASCISGTWSAAKR